MKTKKIPMRRCAGCMESKPKKELIRIVADEEGNLHPDLTGKANGRGVYLCPSAACLALAKKKRAISRSLDLNVTEEQMAALFEELSPYAKENS